MKLISGRIVLAAVIALSLVACDRETHTTFNGQKLSGPLYSIDNVHGWQDQRDVMGADRLYADVPVAPGDDFAENVNVGLEQLSAGMTAQQYIDLSVANASKMLTLSSNLEYKPVKVNSYDGYHARLDHKMGQMDIVADSYIVVNDGVAFVITCTALRDTYDAYKPKFDQVVATFALK